MAIWLTYLVYALAVARVARLVAEDKILEAPRIWVLAKLPEGSLLEYGITCQFCVSVWIGAVAAPVAYFWGMQPWFFVPALALAFSHFTVLTIQAVEKK